MGSNTCANYAFSDKGKGKAHPKTGPEGEQMYSSTLHSTSALDGGGWSTPCPGRITPQGKDPVPIVSEAGPDPRPVWMGAENLAPTGTLYFNTFITFLYMFRALLCSSSGQIVLVQHLVSSLSLGDCSVHRFTRVLS